MQDNLPPHQVSPQSLKIRISFGPEAFLCIDFSQCFKREGESKARSSVLSSSREYIQVQDRSQRYTSGTKSNSLHWAPLWSPSLCGYGEGQLHGAIGVNPSWSGCDEPKGQLGIKIKQRTKAVFQADCQALAQRKKNVQQNYKPQ